MNCATQCHSLSFWLLKGQVLRDASTTQASGPPPYSVDSSDKQATQISQEDDDEDDMDDLA